MIDSTNNPNKNIITASLKLSNGWNGRAVVSIKPDKNFSKNDWTDCLTLPEQLFDDVETILKAEGRNSVAVKNLSMGHNQFRVVIKNHWPKDGLRQFFRSFLPGKALRNFKAALTLVSCGIAAATPLAALQQRRNLLTKQSIYISEYCQNSSNLHTFACEQLSKIPETTFALRKQLCHQLAAILASLHKNGLWHRDSKATNFVVSKDTGPGYRISLTDMDGIKRYFLRRRSRQFRSLWQLAASLMSVSTINRTDYLRTFTAYCNLTGIEPSQRRRFFYQLVCLARKKLEIKSRISK